MADLITRNLLLLAKLESTEGTPNAPVAGDAILAQSIAMKLQRDFHPRNYQGRIGTGPGVLGAQTSPGLSFQAEIKGDGTTNTCELDAILTSGFGSVVAGTGDTTIGAGGAGSTTNLLVTSSTNFTVGNMVMTELTSGGGYEVAMVTAIPDGTHVTVSPALSGTPAAGVLIKEMRTHQVLVPPGSVNSVTADVFYNADSGASQFDRLVGARFNCKWDSPRAGSIPLLTFDGIGWNWTQSTAGTRPTPTFDTASPKAALATKLKVGGTLTDAFDISWDLGAKLVGRLSQNSPQGNGIIGTPVIDIAPSGSFTIHPAHTSVAQFTGWTGETAISLLQQNGNALFGTVAWYCPAAQRTEVTRGDDSGVGTNVVKWQANTSANGLATTGTDAPLYLAVG